MFILVVLIGLVSACQTPTLEATPTTSPTATLTSVPSPTIDWFPATQTPTPKYVQPTPNPLNSLTPPPVGEILVEDGFGSDALWETGKTTAGNIVLEESSLAFALSGRKDQLVSLSPHSLPSDFYLEVSAEVALCSPDDAYGILFWRNSQQGTYHALYNCCGEIRLERTIYDGMSVMQDWISGRRFQPGSPATNQLGIWSDSGTLHFFINDVHQFSFSVRPDLEGKLGLFARSSGESAFTVQFSDLLIYKPAP